MKRAIIFGINGQDGKLLSEILLKKNYEIIGTHYKKIKKKINFKFVKINILDFVGVKKIINKYNPNEVYNFTGISDLKSNEEDFFYSEKINNLAIVNILDTIKNTKIKFFQPITSEIYGNYKYSKKIKLNTPFNPSSSYAISKLSSLFYIRMYREKFNVHCVAGIFFNHESEHRKNKFVTKMIVENLNKINLKKSDQLIINNLSAKRDWGYAKDYMEIAYKALNYKKPNDYLIGNGKLYSVKDIVNIASKYYGIKLKWKTVGKNIFGIDQKNKKIVKSPVNKNFKFKPIYADNSEIKRLFKYKASKSFKELIELMCSYEKK